MRSYKLGAVFLFLAVAVQGDISPDQGDTDNFFPKIFGENKQVFRKFSFPPSVYQAGIVRHQMTKLAKSNVSTSVQTQDTGPTTVSLPLLSVTPSRSDHHLAFCLFYFHSTPSG